MKKTFVLAGSALLAAAVVRVSAVVLPEWADKLQEPTGQVWRPQTPAANSPRETVDVPLVSYGSDWTRHGFGGHGGGPSNFRKATRPLLGDRPADPFKLIPGVDVDGDGDVKDDRVWSAEFSLTEPLNPEDWPLGGQYPHRVSSKFYGGVTWQVANTPAGDKHKYWIEHGINPDHQGPFYDDRAEDHPLNGQPDNKDPKSFVKNNWVFVWKKADFWNGGDKNRVGFDENSYLAATVARYWYGVNDLRMVVQDGDQFYISGLDFWKDSENAGAWTDLTNPAKGWCEGRVFTLYPTKVKWAPYNPQGWKLAYNKQAAFVEHVFTNVQAVGWYIAKDDTTPTFFHTKWYTFEAVGAVERPAQPGQNINMVKVPESNSAPEFYMSACEVPYLLWREIFRYADSPSYTMKPRYNFIKYGAMGSMEYGNQAHGVEEPVTDLTLYDAAGWCNALSEKEGKAPVYYTDAEFTVPYRGDELATRATYKNAEKEKRLQNPEYDKRPLPKLFVKWAADGYRLPTPAEWSSATGNLTAEGRGPANAGQRSGNPETGNLKATQPVGLGARNEAGLYDMNGNVRELAWTYGDVFDPAKNDTITALGGDFTGTADPASVSASPYGDEPFNGSWKVGLRLVCRAAGLSAPSQSAAALSQWGVKKCQKTVAVAKVEKVAKPVLDMAKIPGGKYTRIPDNSEVNLFPFEMAKTETSYAKWLEVKRWAEANGYTFDRIGDMGNMDFFYFTHTPDEPVTRITWHDTLVWCNALSEMEGRTPVYYEDEAMTKVYRNAVTVRPIKIHGLELVKDPFKRGNPTGINYMRADDREPWLFARFDANGYRLPTQSEWDYAVRGGAQTKFFWGDKEDEQDDHTWNIENAGGRTHPVGTKKPNSFGLYDIMGNVQEYSWSTLPPFLENPKRPYLDNLNNPTGSRYWGYKAEGFAPKKSATFTGGSWMHGEFDLTVKGEQGSTRPEQTDPDIGFRVVRCESGVHSRDGNQPLVQRNLVNVQPEAFNLLQGTARGNLYRNGIFETAGVPNFKSVKWFFATGGEVKASPVLANGVVYVGSKGGNFYALSAETGKELWKISVEGGVESSACVADGVVYFGGNDKALYAVDAATGAVKWKTPVKDVVVAAPAVAYGTVFAFIGGRAEGFHADTGKAFWKGRGGYVPPNHISVTLIPYSLLYASGNNNQFFTVDLRTQESPGSQMAGQYSRSTVAVQDGCAYVTSAGNIGGAPGYASISCFDLKTRARKWGRVIEEQVEAKNRMPLFSSPAVWGGQVYIGMDSGMFYGIDTATGKQQWEFKTGAAIRSSSCVSSQDGTIYFGSDDGHLYALDARTGQARWNFKTGSPVQSDPSVYNRVVYFGCDNGNVYALE